MVLSVTSTLHAFKKEKEKEKVTFFLFKGYLIKRDETNIICNFNSSLFLKKIYILILNKNN